MASSIRTRETDKFSKEDIIFSTVQEFQIEECCIGVSEWYASQPEYSVVADQSKSSRITKEDMKSAISTGTVFIQMHLKETKEFVGCIGVSMPEISASGLTSHLFLQSVKTEYRKRGLSTLIYDEALTTAKEMGTNRVTLNVIESLKFQHEFFLKRGFKLMKIITKHKSEFKGSLSISIIDSVTLHEFEMFI